ncbi:hypothetical protein [Streptomyces sp. NPDC005805]|uniref:hypothetical protein n=1 Tax=Streptomyces sp. NPDC005805 TaxID=3157068 RepID=UPI003404D522
MSQQQRAAVGAPAAIFVVFLGLLVHHQLTSPDGDLAEGLAVFALVAVPGALLCGWIAGVGRRKR